jgi:hypothetical protein
MPGTGIAAGRCPALGELKDIRFKPDEPEMT